MRILLWRFLGRGFLSRKSIFLDGLVLILLIVAPSSTFSEIRILREKVLDPIVKKEHGLEVAKRLATKKNRAIEFLKAGSVVQTVDLSDSSTERVVSVILSKNKEFVVVVRRPNKKRSRNPFSLKRSSGTRISWYDSLGNRVEELLVNETTLVRGVSPNGKLAILVDAGFDEAAFYSMNDVPGLKHTAELKKSPELVDHAVTLFSIESGILFTRKIPGPSAPPGGISFSPSGEWFAYSIGNARAYLNNAEKNQEYILPGQVAGWKVTDQGDLLGWKLESDEGRYEKLERGHVWKPGRRIFKEFAWRFDTKGIEATGKVKEK